MPRSGDADFKNKKTKSNMNKKSQLIIGLHIGFFLKDSDRSKHLELVNILQIIKSAFSETRKVLFTSKVEIN